MNWVKCAGCVKRGENFDKAKSEEKRISWREAVAPPTLMVSAIVAGKFRKKERIVKIVKKGWLFWKTGLDAALFFCYHPDRRRKTVESERNFGDASEERRSIMKKSGK